MNNSIHRFDNSDEVDHFLEKYRLPQLSQYETDLNSLITVMEIKLIV